MSSSRSEPTWRRVLLSATVLAFALPFVTVEDCNTGDETAYFGVSLFSEHGWWLLGSVLTAALLLGLSLRPLPGEPLRRAFNGCIRSIVAAAAAAWVWAIVELRFLFDMVKPHVGIVLCTAAWAGVVLLAWGSAFRTYRAFAREASDEPAHPGDVSEILVTVLRATAAAALVPAVVLAVDGPEGVLVDLGLAAAFLVFVTLPAAAALECCAQGARRKERWTISRGFATAASVWTAVGLSIILALAE